MPNTQPNEIAPPDYIPEVSYDNLVTKDYNYRISIEDIIYCIDVLKLNQKQTADKLKCHESNISQRLKAYGYESGDLASFTKQEADRYAIRRLRIAKHITDDKLEKMSAYQLVGMDNITLQQERLLRDQSTSNISYLDVVKVKEVMAARLTKFEDKYSIDPDTIDI